MNPATIHLALRSLMQEAGDFIQDERKKFRPEAIESKGSNDMVSYVDRGAEAILVEGCKKILPDSGFILEEGGEMAIDKRYRWIIDPLDGTTNFVHGFPVYGVSVALQENGVTVLGAVSNLPAGEYFHATLEGGAYLNDRPIRVSTTSDLSRSLIATGFPYSKTDRKGAILSVLDRFLQNCQCIRRPGSAALDLASVACGRMEGYYESGVQAWDVAAGALLVSEAGGRLSDWKGTDNFVFGRQIVASNGQIHEQMLKLL